jgi:glycosyltransferase involved in cell wall biosynthesis
LGRGEAFGVSISEAMAAGIPCIVSNQTGAMEFVEKISSKMVIGQDISTAEEMVKNYFLLKGDEKRKLSKKFKKVSEDLEEKIVLKEYKNKIGDFLNQL